MSTAVALAALSAAVTHAQLATDAAERLADQLVEERSLTEPPPRTIHKTAAPRESFPGSQPVPIIAPKVRAPEPKRINGPSVLLPQAEEAAAVSGVGGGWDVGDVDLEAEDGASTTGALKASGASTDNKSRSVAASKNEPATEVSGSILGDDINEDGWDVEGLGEEPGWEVDDIGMAPPSSDLLGRFNQRPASLVAELVADGDPLKMHSAVVEIVAAGGVWSGSCADFIAAVRAGFSHRPHALKSLQDVWDSLCVVFGYPGGLSRLIPLSPTTTDDFVVQIVKDGIGLNAGIWRSVGDSSALDDQVHTLRSYEKGDGSPLSPLDWLCLLWANHVSDAPPNSLRDRLLDCYLDSVKAIGFESSGDLLATLTPFPEDFKASLALVESLEDRSLPTVCMQVRCVVPDLLKATWEEAGDLAEALLRRRGQPSPSSGLSEAEEFSLV
ncbi:hypothetical protein FOZ61_004381 [Perkinsus olseni]|uniref:Uncharacterized protein n=1 Tax=Perkinsus olseni TaxID=32597 RepID=A0A7J6MD66_PEROL|nr:hypothetical protein FOZ61_004381 [Perkinsus olseni]KAF4674639.1 hypothetical protein FOL46_004426 [Perkinsus olseni]